MVIKNGKNTPVNKSTGNLPQVGVAMLSWFRPMVFGRIVTTVVNFVEKEIMEPFQFQGVWQVMSPQQLTIKPDYQRAWRWFMVHATPNLDLRPYEVINYEGTQYRVMSKSDYKEYGYVMYELCADWENVGPEVAP